MLLWCDDAVFGSCSLRLIFFVCFSFDAIVVCCVLLLLLLCVLSLALLCVLSRALSLFDALLFRFDTDAACWLAHRVHNCHCRYPAYCTCTVCINSSRWCVVVVRKSYTSCCCRFGSIYSLYHIGRPCIARHSRTFLAE